MKRVFLLIATNFAVMILLSIVISVLGLDRALAQEGIQYVPLLIMASIFGFGSGPVRGFATTLTLGLLTHLFTATVFTRMLLTVWVRWRKPTELPLSGKHMLWRPLRIVWIAVAGLTAVFVAMALVPHSTWAGLVLFGAWGILAMLLFLYILLLGWVYAYRERILEWK